MIHSDDVIRLLLEVDRKSKPAIPDTPELAALRAQLIKEDADIKAKGGTVLIPNE
jgi:hypothetical protein